MKMSELEAHVAKKSVEEFRRRTQENIRVEKFLKTKKFSLGTFVVKNKGSFMDGVFGVNGDDVGKIVGWDFENNYYRVYYSPYNPYIGVREENLEMFTGEAPEQLKNHKEGIVKRITVDL
ncbi:hypothetical protein BC351_01180 [Paenibacillus ferrarius]|uniref:Uncharacterized protein n=1 Tax=Paenibacillus ferrarius TaxID=1469647 RepID=A0A1V4HSG2_9BACL|nr:hypothetical protein [Paenibacillus ferrarius]OPH61884.1 hypothetical protein BC351_01180 [Paenibacillus ferrarius]